MRARTHIDAHRRIHRTHYNLPAAQPYIDSCAGGAALLTISCQFLRLLSLGVLPWEFLLPHKLFLAVV